MAIILNVNLENIASELMIQELVTRGYKVSKPRKKTNKNNDTSNITSTQDQTQHELINPINLFREEGEKDLRKQLETYTIEELVKICKQYTPDLNRTIYRSKNKEKVIEYIMMRSGNLATIGQCFRTCTDDTKINA